MPKVSVIIPVYNVEKYLRECLDSVVNQTLEEVEIICINDGSTDNSPKILEEYAAKDSRIKIINQMNQGAGPARNAGIFEAKGDYVAFMDPDDLYPSNNSIEILYEKALAQSALVAGGSMRCFKDGTISESYFQKSSFDGERWLMSIDYQFDYYFQRFIFKRSFLINHNLLFPSLLRYQDPIFMIKVLHLVKKIYVFPDLTYLYRESGNTVTTNLKKVFDMLKGFTIELELAKKYKYFDLYFEIVERINGDYFIRIFKNTKPKISITKSLLIFNLVNHFDYKIIRNYNRNYKLKKYLNKYTFYGFITFLRGLI